MATILKGKPLADAIALDLSARVAALPRQPLLAIVSVGSRPDSAAFIAAKERFATRIGAAVRRVPLAENVTAADLADAVDALALDAGVDGIILQLPIPQNIDAALVLNRIPPEKDVDGLCATNLRAHLEGRPVIMPATARGVCNLLAGYRIPIAGQHAVVVGRSVLVGKSVALALLSQDATVTVCHRKTVDTALITRQADILVVAAGSPKLITESGVKAGATVIDVGISAIGEPDLVSGKRRLVGDVDFDSVSRVAGAISPVPGGVGPMTVSALFQNLVEVSERRQAR